MPFYFNSILITNYGQNICNLRCGSQTSTNFIFFLHNFMNRRLVLTVDLSKFSIQFFFLSLWSQGLSSFHLEEALYGISLAYLNCQCHYSGSSGPLWSRTRLTQNAVMVCWITKTAARWLTVGKAPQTLKSRDSRAGQRARDFITLLKREGNFIFWGRPGGVKGKELACQCRRHKRHVFHPWVGKSSLEEIMATRSSVLAWRIP